MPAEIIGADKLLAKLARMPAAVKSEVRETMAEQANEIVAMMKRLAPVLNEPDPRRTPGALRDSIGWRWGKRAPKGAMSIASVSSGDADLTITIYAGSKNVFWATFQEWGTVKQPAQPFFYVSWRANRKNAKRNIRAAIRRGVKKVAV